MTRAIFTYVAALLMMLPFLPWINGFSTSTQFLACAPIILLLGIPHGAIDHLFYRRNHTYSYWGFIRAYLLLIGLNIGLWLLSPALAYSIFILLSAYHFGQSQFSHFLTQKHWLTKALAFVWGMTVLTGLIFFNQYEVNALLVNIPDFDALAVLHEPTLIASLFCMFSVLSVTSFALLRMQEKLLTEDMLMELLILFLIQVSFFLLPLLPGFTLYFVLLHALKVLREEFHVLKMNGDVKSFRHFIMLLSPFTLFSFAGISFLMLLAWLDILPLNSGFVMLILISSITLPHAIVMNDFYFRLFNAKLLRKHM